MESIKELDAVVFASSSIEAGIGCWDLQTGAEQLRYKSCVSPQHGLSSVGHRFLASSQLRDGSASSGSILYWSWSKPQVEVKSFPAEAINPLAANNEGTYIVGGASSGYVYIWEVASGRLLKKWRAHYTPVTCLVFNEDGSLLISGSKDGCVRVWSLLTVFDDDHGQQASHLYLHSFMEHNLDVNDIIIGNGGSNAIIVSASEDSTCKIWSLSMGRLLRNIVFPSAISAIALDPGENVFYAGGKDGKIYIAALSAESTSTSSYGTHIIGLASDQSKAVTCLTYSSEANLLLSGSDDGFVRVLNTTTHETVRMFRHAKGPVNNILVVNKQLCASKAQPSSRRHGSSLPPPLEKYIRSTDDVNNNIIVNPLGICDDPMDAAYPYLTAQTMNNQIKELQQQGSTAAEMEVEKLKHDLKKSVQMNQKLKGMCDNLHQFFVHEVLDKDTA